MDADFLNNVNIKGDLLNGDDTLSAIYENDTIGHISFCIGRNTDGEPAIAYPKQMHIKEDFQRRGVGTKIIETAASQVSVVFAADQGASGNSDDIHYSSEGLDFKHFCEKKRITREQQI